MSKTTTQQRQILDFLKSRGYWNWIERYEFLDLQPRICDFTTRIHELRWKLDFNIQCETQRVNGVGHSRYRLLPGSWRDLRGNPPEGREPFSETRNDRARKFEQNYGAPKPPEQDYILLDLPLFELVGRP